MSHFIGLVFQAGDKTLDELLEPYNEQTEERKYLGFDDRHDEVVERWNTLPDKASNPRDTLDKEHYPTIDALARDWFEYSKDSKGRYGCLCNLNARWDWWSEGSRWKNYIRGNDGVLKDCEMFLDIDWESMIEDENIPFCIVTHNGEWEEKAEMGWWGMTRNEKEQGDWKDEVARYVRELLKDENRELAETILVTAIDFHI